MIAASSRLVFELNGEMSTFMLPEQALVPPNTRTMTIAPMTQL